MTSVKQLGSLTSVLIHRRLQTKVRTRRARRPMVAGPEPEGPVMAWLSLEHKRPVSAMSVGAAR